MSDHLRDDMRLSAVGSSEVIASLDVMAKMVYRCAAANKTIAETAASCGFDGDLTRRIIEQLVDKRAITVGANAAASSPTPAPTPAPQRPTTPVRRKSTTTPEQQRKFKAFEDTETFIEKLETLYGACRKENFYDLLDVDPDTDRTELRTKYFELSKRFHPDKAFLQEAKERKDKMAFIFQKLTTAYDTLSNAKKRKEYDATIADQLEVRSIERQLKAAVAAARSTNPPARKETSVPPDASGEQASDRPTTGRVITTISRSAPPPPKSGRPGVSSTPPTTSSAPPNAGRVGSMPPAKRFHPSAPSNPGADIRRQEIKRRMAGRAMADLLSRRSLTPANVSDIKKAMDEAEMAMSEERYADAANIAKSIQKQFPSHEAAADLLKRAAEGLARVQARLHMRRGRYAAKDGQHAQAKWHFEQALVIDRNSLDARHLLAVLYLQTERNPEKALALMKEVIVLGGQRARYFDTLGEIFLAIGDHPRASDAFNRALSMEPENQEIRKKLKQCNR